ncbi:MAG: SpoIID/LytB domain-containing protein [Bacteroidales bacterium]|nr:SpoIID/LytB domain-containing protein [Bacteroidales bacterium]
MQKSLWILILILSLISASAQNIKVGLFHKYQLTSLLISPVFGQYELIADSSKHIKLNTNSIVYLNLVNQKIQLKTTNGVIGYYQHIELKGNQSFNTLRIKADAPSLKAREYEDDFVLDVVQGKIRIINNVRLENYIAGVVESEGGIKAGKEYYKTQAILCRTYALENFHKHDADGFNLCDDVHCQAYHSRAKRNDLIVEATSVTKGLVIVDTSLSLITASFYSNSGGQTAASEWVWLQPRSYLKPIVDTFSVGGNNYEWEKRISLSNWISFLKRKGFKIAIGVNGEAFKDSLYERRHYYVFGNDSIPYTQIRTAFNLRSAFFAVDYQNGQIVLNGRGYGHGVGLSQEGAMRMDELGYSYKEIIKYYYQNVFIVSLRALQFFKD